MLGADSSLKAGGVSSATVAPRAIPGRPGLFRAPRTPVARVAGQGFHVGTTHREEAPVSIPTAQAGDF